MENPIIDLHPDLYFHGWFSFQGWVSFCGITIWSMSLHPIDYFIFFPFILPAATPHQISPDLIHNHLYIFVFHLASQNHPHIIVRSSNLCQCLHQGGKLSIVVMLAHGQVMWCKLKKMTISSIR